MRDGSSSGHGVKRWFVTALLALCLLVPLISLLVIISIHGLARGTIGAVTHEEIGVLHGSPLVLVAMTLASIGLAVLVVHALRRAKS